MTEQEEVLGATRETLEAINLKLREEVAGLRAANRSMKAQLQEVSRHDPTQHDLNARLHCYREGVRDGLRMAETSAAGHTFMKDAISWIKWLRENLDG